MRIVVNDIAATTGGALTVLLSFYNDVVRDDTENEWLFLLSDYYINESDNVSVKIMPDVKKSWLNKLKFDFMYGKNIIEKFKPDYVLSLQNIITFGVKQKQAVYVHQAIPFQKTKKFSFLKKEERLYSVYQYLIGSIIKLSIRKADIVFVQTEWMKRAICELKRIEKDKIVVVPIKYIQNLNKQPILITEQNRFFYPASVEAVYKNHRCIYQACDILRNRGIKGFQVFTTLEKPNVETMKSIVNLGILNRQEMTEHYQRSILIFPSYIETVGLPLVEAMQEESIILAADCEYSHEVLDGYPNSFFFNPFNPNELADLMEMVINGIIKRVVSKKTDNYVVNENRKTDCWNIVMNTLEENVRDCFVKK